MSLGDYNTCSYPEYSSETFDSLLTTFSKIRKKFFGREPLKAKDFIVQIPNAQTRKESTADEAETPSPSSLTIVEVSDTDEEKSPKPTDSSPSMSSAQPAKTANLVDANASQDDEIEDMMSQLNHEYDPIPEIDAQGTKELVPFGTKELVPFVPHDQSSPEDDSSPIPMELMCPICNDMMTDAVVISCCGKSYCDLCIRMHLLYPCQHAGGSRDNLVPNHSIRQLVKNYKNNISNTKVVREQAQQAALPPPLLQMSSPLNSSQQDPLLPNVTHPTNLLHSTGLVDANASEDDQSSSSEHDSDSIPGELMCPICHDLMTDAVVISCCGKSYCEICIRMLLLYPCQHAGVSTNELIPNNFLRQLVKNKTNTKVVREQVQQAALPPPLLQWSWPLHSTQKDPLLDNVPHPPPSILPTAAPESQAQPPAPSPPAPVPDPVAEQHSTIHSTGQGEPPPPGSFPGIGDHPPAHTSGLLPPPPSEPIYAPGPPGLNPPWIPPGVQPPLPHLGPPLSQPPLSKKCRFRRRHREDSSSSRSGSSSFSCSPRSSSSSPSHGRSYRRSPDSRHNGRSDRRSRSRSHSVFRCPPPFRARPWEGAEGPAPFRSRSRSPVGSRNRSPGGRNRNRRLQPYELKGPSPGGHDRWERERYRQWEKEYKDLCKKYCKDYDNQHPSYQRGRGSRDRQKDRMSPLPRDYSPQRRGKRDREEEGAPPHQPPSKKSSTKVLKTKTVNKKRPREEPEPSHHTEDSDDASPLKDEPMAKRMYPGPSLIKPGKRRLRK